MSVILSPPDPLFDNIRGLTSDQVRARLDAIEAERIGLSVLLRSLVARERAARRRARARGEVANAD